MPNKMLSFLLQKNKKIIARYVRAIIVGIFLFFSFSAYSRDLLVDTDVGTDDVIALLYLLNHPEIKITAVTIESDGNAHCKPAFATIQAILLHTGQAVIPTACGRASPLAGRHHFPAKVMRELDQLAELLPQKSAAPLTVESAKDLMIKTLQNSAQPIDILALGPLTTIAEVLTAHPELQQKIRHIYLMGGAIHVPGNIKDVDPDNSNAVAEWNIYIDPLAAEKVFHSGVAITLVPLDVTDKVLINQAFYEKIKAHQTTPEAKLVYLILKQNKKILQANIWYFWDPMAAVIATTQNIAVCPVLPVSVRLSPDSQSGKTFIDKKFGAPIQVCLNVNAAKFKANLLAFLLHN